MFVLNQLNQSLYVTISVMGACKLRNEVPNSFLGGFADELAFANLLVSMRD